MMIHYKAILARLSFSGKMTMYFVRSSYSSWLSATIGPLMERRRESQDIEGTVEGHPIKAVAAFAIFIQHAPDGLERMHVVSYMRGVVLAVIAPTRLAPLAKGFLKGFVKKQMHIVWLDIERTNTPLLRFADAAKFLFNKGSKLANQKLFPVCGAPDKVIGQLIRHMFGVLRVHPQHYNRCSSFREELRWAALPPDESWGYPSALP